eukprot:scaffold726_cov262-Pinguiococcus_pyrenoidosus.AAC.7
MALCSRSPARARACSLELPTGRPLERSLRMGAALIEAVSFDRSASLQSRQVACATLIQVSSNR